MSADEDSDSFYVCCGKPMTWDPNRRGFTCGGLELQGWMTCAKCDAGMLVSRHRDPLNYSRVPSASDTWAVAKGGRSVVCGAIKLRPEKGERVGIKALLERIVKLPEIEAEVERLRTELGYAKQRRDVEPDDTDYTDLEGGALPIEG